MIEVIEMWQFHTEILIGTFEILFLYYYSTSTCMKIFDKSTKLCGNYASME